MKNMKYYIEDGGKDPNAPRNSWWFLVDDNVGIYAQYYYFEGEGLCKNNVKRYLKGDEISNNLDYSIEVTEEEWYNEMYLVAI